MKFSQHVPYGTAPPLSTVCSQVEIRDDRY
jgi:hypothetical protein